MYDFLNDPRFKGIEPFKSKLWLASPTMHGDEQRWVDEAIQTNWVSTVGENINVVERQVAEKVGRKYAVALSSGTAALHLAIKICGEKLYGQAPVGHGTLEGHRVFASDVGLLCHSQLNECLEKVRLNDKQFTLKVPRKQPLYAEGTENRAKFVIRIMFIKNCQLSAGVKNI